MAAVDGLVSPSTRIVEELAPGDGLTFPKTGDKVRHLLACTASPVPLTCGRPALQVLVHYTGCIAETGRCFDSSRARGHAFTFTIGCGRVIKGWDALLVSVSKGARVTMHVAAVDAYGEAGHPPNVPRNADLIFDVELLNINESLVQEGVRYKQELEEIARQEVEAEQSAAMSRQRERETDVIRSCSSRARDSRSDSDSSYSSCSQSSRSSRAIRKRRKREKERKRERHERKAERKERKRRKRDKVHEGNEKGKKRSKHDGSDHKSKKHKKEKR